MGFFNFRQKNVPKPWFLENFAHGRKKYSLFYDMPE